MVTIVLIQNWASIASTEFESCIWLDIHLLTIDSINEQVYFLAHLVCQIVRECLHLFYALHFILVVIVFFYEFENFTLFVLDLVCQLFDLRLNLFSLALQLQHTLSFSLRLVIFSALLVQETAFDCVDYISHVRSELASIVIDDNFCLLTTPLLVLVSKIGGHHCVWTLSNIARRVVHCWLW